MAKYLRLEAAILIQMKGDESSEDAEDRLITSLEDVGLSVLSWWNTSILEHSDEERDD